LNITEVRVKLMQNRSDRLRAFASITIDDDFVVHDLRVIEGRSGFFVAMPSRKLSDSCGKCGSKNELRAKFCGNCGARLDEHRATRGSQARDKFHVDVAHPINTACREMLQEAVLRAYHEEAGRAAEGLPPSREYSVEDVDELTEDYAEVEYDESAEAFQPQEPAEQEDVATQAPETEPVSAEQEAEEEAFDEVPWRIDVEETEATGPPEPTPPSFAESAPEEETDEEAGKDVDEGTEADADEKPDADPFAQGIF